MNTTSFPLLSKTCGQLSCITSPAAHSGLRGEDPDQSSGVGGE